MTSKSGLMCPSAEPDGAGAVKNMLTLAGANPFHSRMPFFLAGLLLFADAHPSHFFY